MATEHSWEIIEEEAKKLLFMGDVQRMDYMKTLMNCCGNLREQVILALFYIYGMRPEELLVRMTKGNFSLMDNEDGTQTFRVLLPTVKKGRDRIIDLNPKTTPFIDVIVNYLNTIPNVTDPLFREYTHPTSLNKQLSKVSDRYFLRYNQKINLSPYVFRKFRLSYLSACQATPQELLDWKGGSSLDVLTNSYLFSKPISRFKDTIR